MAAKTPKLGKAEKNRIQYDRYTDIRESLVEISKLARDVLDNLDPVPHTRAIAEADFRYADGAIAMIDKWRAVHKKGMGEADGPALVV